MSAPAVGVNPEKVINRLAQQIGVLNAELAMRDAALDDVQQQLAAAREIIAGLEQGSSEAPS
jgi:septal ring factor EnvC (AmiA/AmiB activator)